MFGLMALTKLKEELLKRARRRFWDVLLVEIDAPLAERGIVKEVEVGGDEPGVASESLSIYPSSSHSSSASRRSERSPPLGEAPSPPRSVP